MEGGGPMKGNYGNNISNSSFNITSKTFRKGLKKEYQSIRMVLKPNNFLD